MKSKIQYVYGDTGTVAFQVDEENVYLAIALKNTKDKNFPKKLVREVLNRRLNNPVVVGFPTNRTISIERLAGFIKQEIANEWTNWPPSNNKTVRLERLVEALKMAFEQAILTTYQIKGDISEYDAEAKNHIPQSFIDFYYSKKNLDELLTAFGE